MALGHVARGLGTRPGMEQLDDGWCSIYWGRVQCRVGTRASLVKLDIATCRGNLELENDGLEVVSQHIQEGELNCRGDELVEAPFGFRAEAR